MDKFCSRWGIKISKDTKICNGCGNKCDFTNTHTHRSGTKMVVSIVAFLPIIALIIVAILLNV